MMIEQYFKIIGTNKFNFRIVSISKYLPYKGIEILINNNDIFISTPTTGKDKGYHINRETFYMFLFNFETKPTAEELKKISLLEIRVASNVNPRFVRNLLHQIHNSIKK